MKSKPITAASVPARKGQTFYPDSFAAQVQGRTKRKLGDLFDLANFGVNLTQLDPGAVSALFHRHTTQDEFIFILEGSPMLLVGDDEFPLAAGDCMGFKAGGNAAHQLINRSDELVTYIEMGDRSPNDEVEYPKDDIRVDLAPDGSWIFSHKNGTHY